MKRAKLRPSAKSDLSDQALYYAGVAGQALANRFVDEALATLVTIEGSPAIGSARWSRAGMNPPLRAWRVERFPVIWFYFEREDHLDVVRLLGQRQDLAAILAAELD